MVSKAALTNIADEAAKSIDGELLKVSFEYMEWGSEYFFFHGLEEKYYQKFFECVTTLQSSTNKDIAQQSHPSLNAKSIFNTDSSIRDSFPEEVVNRVKDRLYPETRDEETSLSKALEITRSAFEVRLSKNYGRLHGFLWNNIFHVVWVDPAHNLYCGKKTPKKYKEIATVRSFAPDETLVIKARLHELQEQLGELFEAWANGKPQPE